MPGLSTAFQRLGQRLYYANPFKQRKIRRKMTDQARVERVLKKIRPEYVERIEITKSCPDNADFVPVADAGKIEDGWITMHNGLEVAAFSYYQELGMHLLHQNHGIHEPQEEKIFRDVLPLIAPGGVMLELGAYWGFYSLWFDQVVPNATCYLVEPLRENLICGQMHYERAGRRAEFRQAFIAGETKTDEVTPTWHVDGLLEREGIDRLAILHADIQGYETEMLQGAEQTLTQRKADFLFISTHGEMEPDRHSACEKRLLDHGYRILTSVRPEESYSFDGILVAASPLVEKLPETQVSKRPLD